MTTGADYDISESAAGELPALSVPDAVVVPEPLTLTSPELDGSAPPSLAENALAFTYKGGGSADRIILELRYVEGESSEVIQTISCIETNDGSITVPNGLFSLYSASDHVLVSLMALEEGSSVLDFNQAEFRVAGMHTLVGAFYPDP